MTRFPRKHAEPASQIEHESEPGREKVPGAHDTQLEEEVAPSEEEYVPGGQGTIEAVPL